MLEGIRPKVTLEMNEFLLKSFSKEDVDLALKSFHSNKASGPYGFSAGFYKKLWSVVLLF